MKRPLSRVLATALAALFMAVAAAPSFGDEIRQSAPADADPATSADPFDDREADAIRDIVRDYLLENPEIVFEALQILRAREREDTAERQRSAVIERMAELSDPGPLPVLGNPDGDVTVVEFTDYRCPYCRGVAPDLREAVAADGNVRLVIKEWPVLGSQSLFAARAALAASKQNAYEAFHDKLMTEVQPVDEASVMALAERLGLDLERLEADMQASWVNDEIRRTFHLAQALEITGTPAFVIGERVVPGAVDRERLEQLISEARAAEG